MIVIAFSIIVDENSTQAGDLYFRDIKVADDRILRISW